MSVRAPAAAVLAGAALLFLVQPMAAKMVLPALGGAPAVWNTCMVFFQAALLVGYLYAHLLTTYLSPSRQAVVHLALVVTAAATLPPALPGVPPAGQEWPTAWLLLALTRSVGAPLVVLASTGPLLQRWVSLTSARDPYPLYAAGNAGSFGALLAYPLAVEPLLDLATQRRTWAAAFCAYALLLAACALPLLRMPAAPASAVEGAAPLSWRRRGRWLVLAAVPACAMLGVTQHLTQDVAAIPLLWVLPLSLYLLTFVLAFSGRRSGSSRRWGFVLALAAVPAAAGLAAYSSLWSAAFPGFHLAALLATGMLCHGALADDRPPASRLTSFYLAVATGGVLGGLFAALAAPLLFRWVAEYPIALAAAVLVRAALARGQHRLALALLAPAAVVLAALCAGAALQGKFGSFGWVWIAQIGIPGAVCLAFAARPAAFAAAFVAFLWLAHAQGAHEGRLLHARRTFFGVTRVEARDGPPLWHPRLGRLVVARFHVLYHGSTVHGRQAQAPELRAEASSYYHRTGPIGRLFAAVGERPGMDAIAVIGLGAGSLAAYGRPGQRLTVYEIDPEVVRTARDPSLFTFLRDSAAEVRVVLGDGRLQVARAPRGSYGLVVLDAFSSDAIPVHLLTREALQVYLRALRPEGILAFHLSNRYLDLVRVADALAADAGLTGVVMRDPVSSVRERAEGKEPSTWVFLARGRAALGTLPSLPFTRPLPTSPVPSRRYLWTDSFSNLVSVFHLSPVRS
ncbi:MAG TPA: fused MFS/spermidine synthase [Candidatus Polarisedimenticolaceae bacterium]|nr:fused MFS/spermidine synthase [Candidatus Polarisedimenticolaceae bacterium]